MADEPSRSPSAENPVQDGQARDGSNSPRDSNNPVLIMKDTVGAVVLGVISLVLLFALWRALARSRKL